MKILQRHIILCSCAALLSGACSKPEGEDVPKGIEIHAGSAAWLGELNKLKQARGILPNGTGYSATNIIYRDPAVFYEFFAFDDNVSLILLSHSPVYFLKIESREFRYHLNNELVQVNQGLTGEAKSINSLTFYKQVGDHSVEVYFSPKEIYFSTGSGAGKGRIKIKNDTSFLDLWRLSEAANDVVFYTPLFEEQKVAEDFLTHSLDGKRRLILTDSSTMANPKNYNITPLGLNFSAMLGTGLTITDNLLGTEDIRFIDRYALTRDFVAFFSVPIGNSRDAVNNHLSQKDGIAVIIRGDVSKYRNFLSAQGVNFSQSPVFNVSQALATATTNLEISFSGPPNAAQAQNIANYCIALTADGNCNTPDLTISNASVAGGVVTLTTSAQTASSAYTVYVNGVVRANDGATVGVSTANFTGYKPAASVKITEVFMDDSTDSIEFRITNAGYMDGMKIYIGGSLKYTFPNSNPFSVGDMIVVHLQATGTDETTSNAALSVDAGATAGYDFWQTGTSASITSTDSEAEIQNAVSVTLDYVAWSDGVLGSGQATRVENKVPADWIIAGSTVAASDLVDSALDDGTNKCLQRINTGAGTTHLDTGSKANWTAGTCDLGNNQSVLAPTFNVNSATATALTTMTVTFNAIPNSAPAQTVSNYCIALTADGNCATPDLTISNATLVGSTVTLTTSSQTPATAYTVYVSNVTSSTDGSTIVGNTANFTGYKNPAGLVISEIFIDDSADAVEFRVTSPGYIDGMTIYLSDNLRYTFPNANPFSTGDIIVFHGQAAGTDEASGNAALSGDAGATVGYDFWQSGSAITSTDAEIEIQTALGSTIDYAAWTDGGFGTGQSTRVDVHVSAGHWSKVTGTLAVTDLINSSADDGTNLCLQRINTGAGTAHVDGNGASDWRAGTCVLGTNQDTSPPPFNVNSASATALTTLTVTFSAAPNTAQAQTSTNYCIALTADGNCSTPDLTISGAVLAGSTVTLTTSAQTGGAAYTIYVTGVTASAGGTALTTNTANFSGYVTPATLIINEIAANEASGQDHIELYVVSGGSINGLEVFEGGTSLKVFPFLVVATGDYIVVHTNVVGTDETVSKNQSSDTGNVATAWDFWSADTGLTATDNAIILKNSGATILDACIFGNNSASWTGPTISTVIDPVIAAGQWTKAGGTFVESDAVMPAAGGMAAGQSAKRSPNITDTNNSKVDWVVTAGLTIGSANP